ncbi:hypothetical protein [Zhengella mangrovi]|uniref:hypothetical protein n=1 Tax=Zhengella mangrovi TaxID=1982044 RepID=UPI0013FD7089|nr:hypothetical protein [Zhengella mangrovi]
MPKPEDEVEITISISREAYEKAARMIHEDHGPGGQHVRFMTTEEYIEQLVETALAD